MSEVLLKRSAKLIATKLDDRDTYQIIWILPETSNPDEQRNPYDPSIC